MTKSILNDIAKLTPGIKFGKSIFKKANFSKESYDDDGYLSDPALIIFSTILMIVALYLAFKCNKEGLSGFFEILLATLFSPIYIAYRLAVPC
jgi:hypothetical protein